MRVVDDIVPPKPSDDELSIKTATALIILGFILGFTVSAYIFLETEQFSEQAIIAIDEQMRLLDKIMPFLLLLAIVLAVVMSLIIYTGGVRFGDDEEF